MRSIAIALALLLAAPTVARAEEPSPQVRAKAKAHIKKARAAYDAGNYDQAVAEYEAAYKILPLADVLFNEGQILRVKGDKPAALKAYRRYLASASSGGHAEEARGFVASLEHDLVPEDDRARFDRVRERYQADQGDPVLDEKWAAVEDGVSDGASDVGDRLRALERALDEKHAPKPRIDEQSEKRAVAVVAQPAVAPRHTAADWPTLKRKWWFWTAVGGGAAVVIAAIAVGAVLGTQQSDPMPTIGVLK